LKVIDVKTFLEFNHEGTRIKIKTSKATPLTIERKDRTSSIQSYFIHHQIHNQGSSLSFVPFVVKNPLPSQAPPQTG